MQFTSGLVGSGWEPEEMQVACEVSFEIGLGITGVDAHRDVTVDGLTDEQIYDIAQRAKIMCPISRALTGIDITLDLPDLILEDDEDEEAEDEDAATRRSRRPRAERLRWRGHVQSRKARSRSSSAPTPRRRTACRTLPSTTTTARRRRSAAA